MMNTMLPEKADALKKEKAKPNNNAPWSRPSCGKKRSLHVTAGLLTKPHNCSNRLERDTTHRESVGEVAKAKAELTVTGAELANASLASAEAELVKAKAELTSAMRAADAAEQEKAIHGLCLPPGTRPPQASRPLTYRASRGRSIPRTCG